MLDFEKSGGLVPAIVQDDETGEVLMLAYMNEEAWNKTLASGKAHYWSRSRKKLWLKGGTSGHIQEVQTIYVDCDLDTVVLKVHQVGGAACHEGYSSCFYRKVEDGELKTTGTIVFDPKEVYKT
jgi:phosphoribosyl-AMP cyclohydrolase